eukprot:TRINITY_DN37436_c0_g1_i5.p1 TRINITY_DN37436_c0_g1~~TRINITY_DN37436_c0_g1_i5.p1  ORF type:complete len:117 (-),score=6.57 TRINITY_DN37436_c0_g1_i5:163-513(-)
MLLRQFQSPKRVISWSSLDWDRGRWNQLDLVIGTAFDMFIHVANAVFLSHYLTREQIWGGLFFVIVGYLLVFNNPKFAWCSRHNIPDWVAKRVKPLSQDQVQPISFFDQMLVSKND